MIVSLSYLFRVTDVMEYYFQAKKMVKVIFISKVSSLLIITLLQYYGVKHHFEVDYFAKLLALDFLIQGAIYMVIIVNVLNVNIGFPQFSRSLAIHLLKSSYPLIISNLLVSLYITIDDIFLKYYHDTEAVGLFSLVQFLVIILTWKIGFSIINALYPSLASSYIKKDKTEYYIKLFSMFKILIYLGIVIGLFFTFFGDFILETFFIDSYKSASLPLKIFSWAPLIIFIGMLFEKHLINTRQLQKNIYRFVLGIVVMSILSYLLVPRWSVIGVSIAVIISHLLVNVGYIFIDTDTRKEVLVFLKK
jgi:O-antigen/teichoic acid export membrane protein